MDWTLYWFMLPVASMVATTAMLSGIGGGAIFLPIYILVLPILGPQYPLQTTSAAVITSLITMSFSFASGVTAYAREGLINYNIGKEFLILSIPMALVAGFLAPHLPDWISITLYSVTIIIVAGFLIKTSKIILPARQSPVLKSVTLYGAFMTGVASIGIGETTIVQLLSRDMDKNEAAATSVFIVFLTVMAASIALIFSLFQSAEANVIPWNVICYTVPGVIIGAQIGVKLQPYIPKRKLELSIAAIFLILAPAMIASIA